MTVFLRDMSDYDTNEDLTGFVGTTHKATEGTSITHAQYARRLNKFRAQGYPVLGAYHVVRTPGSGGSGSLSSQLDFWLSYLDSQTPWWRSHPHFILQADLEKWSYDQVSASTGIEFARLLTTSGVPGWKVTYASRGQFGDSLSGITTPLWNAAYRDLAYPGDQASDWNPYSGKTPTLWQYTSTPFDKNAFRGSLGDLLTLIGGTDMTTYLDLDAQSDIVTGITNRQVLNDVWHVVVEQISGIDPDGSRFHFPNRPKALDAKLDAILAAVGKPVSVTLDDTTRQALVSSVVAALQTLDVGLTADALAKVEQAVHAELAKVQITVGA